MAQAQYDKFVALRKSGIDQQTARKQAYGDIPVAPPPVTTVAPTPTAPTPPLAPTQTMKGVNGETFQVAPTNPNTGLTQPTQPASPVQAKVTPPETTVASAVTPTPTPEVAPTPLDKTAEIKAKNEAQMALNKQKSELAIQDRKQAEADAKLASTPTDEKGVLNAFMTWASVPKQNTQDFRNAEFKYNNFKKFSTMTPTQLLDNMKMWEIGTETATLLAQNPNYIKAKEEFDKFQKSQSINNMMKSVAWGATGKTEWVDYYGKAQSDVAKKLWVNETNAEAFARIVWGNELVQTLTKTVSDTAKQLNTLNTERNAVYADLKKQYPDMSASAIMTLMWTRTKETTDQINALNSTLTLTQADLKDAMAMAQAEYGATQADIALQADIAKEQRTIDNALALNQAEFDQKIAQQAQAMNDPVQAISTMVDEYKKLGIIPPKTAQTLLEEYAKSGKPLWKFLSTLQSDIQNTEEYKAYKAKQSGTEWQSTSITRYNPSTWANESTPIFYRKKTSGGFEAVDLAGNPIDVSNLWGATSTPSGTLPFSFTWDTTSYIASKEGFRDTAYQDSGWVWTIGYGTTKINGKPIQPWQKITQAEAQKQLEADIVKHSNWKNYIDENTLSPSQKTALASFEYNLWPWIWDKWAVNIINMIKSWDLTWASKEIQKYNTVKWTVVKWLTNRRNEEAQLLLSTWTSTTPTQTYSPDKIKSFEAFNGTTFPADYKTPAQQKVYRDEYNAWRDSQASNAIKTGQDIINIRLSDKATEWEKASIQYASRGLNAINDLWNYEDTFAKLPLKDQLYQTYAPQLLKSDNQKILEARKKDFITAILRKESGASIAPSEFANEEKKYFAQAWDSPAVLIAKQNARNFAIKSLLTWAGQDVNGRAINTLYNPPAIEASTWTETMADRLARLRKQ